MKCRWCFQGIFQKASGHTSWPLDNDGWCHDAGNIVCYPATLAQPSDICPTCKAYSSDLSQPCQYCGELGE